MQLSMPAIVGNLKVRSKIALMLLAPLGGHDLQRALRVADGPRCIDGEP